MIDVFIQGRNHQTDARGQYNPNNGEIIVIKGTVVSESISDFKQRDSIVALRKDIVDEKGVLKRNTTFKNPTAAAQFVCGYSVSGPIAWHVEKHKTLSAWLKENQ